MLLPATQHRELARGEPIIYSGWAVSRKVLKGKPVYYILTPNTLSGYTEKQIKKGKNVPKLSMVTSTIGSQNVIKSKDGYTLTFVGRESPTSTPTFIDIESEDPNTILEWYFALVSQWRESSGALKYNNLPPDIAIPEHLKHYLYEPPLGRQVITTPQTNIYTQGTGYPVAGTQIPVSQTRVQNNGSGQSVVTTTTTIPETTTNPVVNPYYQTQGVQKTTYTTTTQPQYTQYTQYPQQQTVQTNYVPTIQNQPQIPQTSQTVVTTQTSSVPGATIPPKNVIYQQQGPGSGISHEYK